MEKEIRIFDTTKGDRRGAAPRRMPEMWGAGNLLTGAPSGPIARAGTHNIELVEYAVLEVRLPSHGDRIGDVPEGPSRAISSHSKRSLRRSARVRLPGFWPMTCELGASCSLHYS
jgi:hypothetical protein